MPTGAAKDRKETCADQALPPRYKSFLDTSFLGPEQCQVAGPVEFAYYRFGPLSSASTDKSGTALLMMVGLGCTKSSWTPDLLYTLAESREVLIIDHKGSGYSRITDGGEAVSIEDYGQSVLDLLAALGIKNPDVMGFSMGGLVAQYLATHHGEAVNRIVVANTGARRASKDFTSFPGLDPADPVHIWEGMSDPAGAFPDTPAGNAGLSRYIHFYRAMPRTEITEAQIIAQRRLLQSFMRENDVYEKLGEVTKPLLVVVGTQTGEGPASFELSAKVPGSTVIGFEDAGHMAVFQNGLLAGILISAFLDSGEAVARGVAAA